jgi:hypothetical protein
VETTGQRIKNQRSEVARIESLIASNRKVIPDHERQLREATQDAAKHAPDAANNIEKARKEYDRAIGSERLHRDRLKDLQATDAGLRQQLIDANVALERSLVEERMEVLIGSTGDLHSISRQLSDALAAPAAKCAELKTQLRATFAAALPLLGDRQRFADLENTIRQSVDHAVRAELQKSFSAQGIELSYSVRDKDSDFETVMAKPISDLISSLECVVHSASNVSIEGRSKYRACTGIGGLHGMAIAASEIVSLKTSDPAVRRLVEQGALEEIIEDKGAS